MSKIIAVEGAPGGGKSTVALKLAQEIYAQTGKPVLYLSPDLKIPCMGIIFPSAKAARLCSVGRALDRTEILPEDVMAQIVTSKFMENFGYLGYKVDEDELTYPTPTDDKIYGLFNAMKEIAEYSVVDCDRDENELISSIARGEAEKIVQIFNPDLRCMAYYGKHFDKSNGIKVMNIMDKDIFLPTREVSGHFGGIEHIIPYSREVKQQGIVGTLPQYVNDRAYRSALAKVAKELI